MYPGHDPMMLFDCGRTSFWLSLVKWKAMACVCLLSGVGNICHGIVFRDPLSLDLSKPIHEHG